jgi:hypothetical protein
LPANDERLTTSALPCSAPRGAQHLGGLAVEEDDRPQVDGDLHVDVFALLLGDRGANPNPGVVDENVEPAEALAVPLHDALDAVFVGHVGRNRLDVVALVAKLRRGRLQGLRFPRADRQ